MLEYIVRATVDRAVEEQWLAYMRDTHVPEVMDTGFFKYSRILKVRDPEPNAGKAEYVIRYTCESLEQFVAYNAQAAPALQRDHAQHFEERVTTKRMLLDELGCEDQA